MQKLHNQRKIVYLFAVVPVVTPYAKRQPIFSILPRLQKWGFRQQRKFACWRSCPAVTPFASGQPCFLLLGSAAYQVLDEVISWGILSGLIKYCPFGRSVGLSFSRLPAFPPPLFPLRTPFDTPPPL